MRRLVYEISKTTGEKITETAIFAQAQDAKKAGLVVTERLDWVEEAPPKLTEKQAARRKKVATKK